VEFSVADERPVDSLARTLLDMRLALVALAVVVEVLVGGTAIAILALLLALPLSYVPLRRLTVVGPMLNRRRLLLLLDALYTVGLIVILVDPQIMLLYALSTVALAALAGDVMGAVVVSAVLAGFLVGASILTALEGDLRATSVATSLAFAALYVLTAFGTIRLTRFLRDHERAMARSRAATERAASAEERSRLAREMHDSLSKTLHGTHLLAAALRRRLEHETASPQVRADAEHLVTACQIATRDARRVLHDLRDGDSAEVGLAVAIERVVVEWQTRTGQHVDLHADLDAAGALPPAITYELRYMLAEALENAYRHAAGAGVLVDVRHVDGWLDVVVRDNGPGFVVPDDPSVLSAAGHYGLLGVRERAKRIGADVELDSAPGRGTTVRFLVPGPVPEATADRDAEQAVAVAG
jgi:signal transduction histidine kinase